MMPTVRKSIRKENWAASYIKLKRCTFKFTNRSQKSSYARHKQKGSKRPLVVLSDCFSLVAQTFLNMVDLFADLIDLGLVVGTQGRVQLGLQLIEFVLHLLLDFNKLAFSCLKDRELGMLPNLILV